MSVNCAVEETPGVRGPCVMFGLRNDVEYGSEDGDLDVSEVGGECERAGFRKSDAIGVVESLCGVVPINLDERLLEVGSFRGGVQ